MRRVARGKGGHAGLCSKPRAEGTRHSSSHDRFQQLTSTERCCADQAARGTSETAMAGQESTDQGAISVPTTKIFPTPHGQCSHAEHAYCKL